MIQLWKDNRANLRKIISYPPGYHIDRAYADMKREERLARVSQGPVKINPDPTKRGRPSSL